MNIPDAKTLKRLADSCRKAGIKHFKSGDLEFTLSDDAPVSNYKKQKSTKLLPHDGGDTKIDTGNLSDEQLLFYSVVDPTSDSPEESVQ